MRCAADSTYGLRTKYRSTRSELPQRHNEVTVRHTGSRYCFIESGGRAAGVRRGYIAIYVLLFVSAEQSLDMRCQSRLFVFSIARDFSSPKLNRVDAALPNLNRGEALLYEESVFADSFQHSKGEKMMELVNFESTLFRARAASRLMYSSSSFAISESFFAQA